MDTEIYLDQAGEILRGDWLGKDVYFQTGFLYPYFLAAFKMFFGTDILPVQVAQIVIDSFSAVLLSVLSKRFFGVGAGLLTGLGYALYGPFIAGSCQLLIDLPILFPLFAGLVLYFRGFEGRKPVVTVLAGLLLGVALVSRPYLLPLVCIPLITALIQKEKAGLFLRLKFPLLVSVSILIVVVAVALRNKVVGNEWVLTSAGGGWVFFLGNNPQATGGFYIPQGLGVDENPFRYAKSTLAFPSQQLARLVTWSEGSNFWFRKGLSYWQDDPWGSLSLTMKKIGLCFNNFEVSDNYDYNYLKLKIPWLHFPWLGFGLIAPFGLLGMIIHRKRLFELMLPYSIVFLVASSQVLILVYTRHRYVLAAMLIFFGSSAVIALWNWWQLRKFKQILLSIVVLLLMALFTVRDAGMVDARFKSALNTANGLWNVGRTEEAVGAYEEIFDLNPNSQEGALNYAISLASIGQISRAREILISMIDRTSSYPQGHQLLRELFKGELPKGLDDEARRMNSAEISQSDIVNMIKGYFRERRFLEAKALAIDVYRRFPESDTMIGQLAYAEDHLGNFKEAAVLYQDAYAQAPSQINLVSRRDLTLGFVALMTKDLVGAEKAFRDAISLTPDFAEAYYGLGVVLNKKNQISEAIVAYQKSIKHAGSIDRWIERAKEDLQDIQTSRR